MQELEEVKARIEELRRMLNELVEKKGELLDPEVVEINAKLDAVLVEYYRLINKKTK